MDDNELLDEKKFQSKSDGSSQKRTKENSTFLDEDMNFDTEKINSTSEDENVEINLDPIGKGVAVLELVAWLLTLLWKAPFLPFKIFSKITYLEEEKI